MGTADTLQPVKPTVETIGGSASGVTIRSDSSAARCSPTSTSRSPRHRLGRAFGVEVGTRVQVSNWSVLDLGLSARLDKWEAGNAEFGDRDRVLESVRHSGERRPISQPLDSVIGVDADALDLEGFPLALGVQLIY